MDTVVMRAVVGFADPVLGSWSKGQRAPVPVTDRVVALVDAGYLTPDWGSTPITLAAAVVPVPESREKPTVAPLTPSPSPSLQVRPRRRRVDRDG